MNSQTGVGGMQLDAFGLQVAYSIRLVKEL